jgi:hypothetical protein
LRGRHYWRLLPALLAAALPYLASPAQAAAAGGSRTGYDISFPQCPARFPSGGAFGVVGVNNGLPWSANPCLGAEYSWAAGLPDPPGFYMNTSDPGPASSRWAVPGPRPCLDPTSYADAGCAYDYGWKAAAYAFMTAATTTSPQAASGDAWWLDVETANSWDGTKAANAADVQGSVDFLRSVGVGSVGVYSTGYQWGLITGGYAISSAPSWVAGAGGAQDAARRCQPANAFTGGSMAMVQYVARGFDTDYRCG